MVVGVFLVNKGLNVILNGTAVDLVDLGVVLASVLFDPLDQVLIKLPESLRQLHEFHDVHGTLVRLVVLLMNVDKLAVCVQRKDPFHVLNVEFMIVVVLT